MRFTSLGRQSGRKRWGIELFRRTIERGQKSSCCYVKRTKPWKRARRASASPFCCFPPFFPRFPASPVPVSFPLRSNRYASFSTFFNHIELRIGAYQIFGKTIKKYFHFPRFQKSCRFEFRYVQTLATRYSPKVLRPSLLWFVFDSSLENALHILIVEGTFNFRISRYLSLVASLRYAAKVRCSFDNERVVNNTFDDQKKRSRGPRESVSSGFVTRCRAWWLFRSSHWP